ncbi:MAG: DUF1844 domain-containing protein [Planctomycetales bacterium]|nr:DUF1844 domain-containing protein [Planctomycetales bacterium]
MNNEHEPKIIIDEDWKSQAQAEKEAAERMRAGGDKPDDTASAKPDATAQAASRDKASESKPAADVDDPPLPPASLPMLVTTLATQAMIALGIVPDPAGDKPVVRLNQAKHMIDLLAMLEEKTKGNLASDEAEMLQDALHQLRMAYVAVKSANSK